MFDLARRQDRQFVALVSGLERPFLGIVALVASAVLLLWIAPPLAAYAPAGWSRMTPATAGGMLIATIAAADFLPRKHGRIASLFVLAGGIVAFQVSGVGLPGLEDVPRSLLPSPQTAATFVLFGFSCVLVCQMDGKPSVVADTTVIVLFAVLLFMLGGHLFRLYAIVGTADGRLMSVQTLFCFSLLALVLVSRRMKSGGLLSELTYTGTGSQMSRRLLPFVIAIPFAVFLTIAYLDHTGIMPLARGEAISVPILVLLALGVIAWMARRINALEADLTRQSITDQLTGVLNRRGLDVVSAYMLPNLKRRGDGALVYFFDLDGLKTLNDTQGHEAGSLLITSFARHLVSTFRGDDIVARVGGDEFVVLAAGSAATSGDVLARLHHVMNRQPDGRPSISFSVGVAPVAEDAKAVDDALLEADMKMYQDKEARRQERSGRAPTLAGTNVTSGRRDALQNSA